MGCDIHTFVEKKSRPKWQSIDRFKLNPYHGEEGEHEQYSVVDFHRGRDYRLFAVLADVRNNSENRPICDPRGLPEDCNDIITRHSASWDMDGHSHSYHTLADLEAYALENPDIKHSGMMSPKDAALVDEGKMPQSWCQATNQKTYVYREWTQNLNILTPLIEDMRKLMTEEYIYEPTEIRIVFWFDN